MEDRAKSSSRLKVSGVGALTISIERLFHEMGNLTEYAAMKPGIARISLTFNFGSCIWMEQSLTTKAPWLIGDGAIAAIAYAIV